MHKIRRVNIERSEKIYEKIDAFARKLKRQFPIKEIYLYGSFARRDINEGSDIDILIVGDFQEPFLDRINRILSLTDLPVEPLVYTPEEFSEMRKNDNRLILEVLRTGKRLG